MIHLADTAFIKSDRYYVRAEINTGEKVEIGEYDTYYEARGAAYYFLFETREKTMPRILIKRVMVVEEDIR